MKSLKDGIGYNERLFSGGIRSYLHLARFKWLKTEVTRRNCKVDFVLELGCFDGKLIDFFPIKPLRYIGFDANWEGGLDIAKINWANKPEYSFLKASSPEEMLLNREDIFDIAVAMETLEHVSPISIDGYLQKIAERLDGYFFITVPNEKGIVFLIRWLIKNTFSKDTENYTFRELLYSTFGNMKLVDRREHKGFDYKELMKNIEIYFDIINVVGFPFGFLPKSFCFGIGIIAKSKRSSRAT